MKASDGALPNVQIFADTRPGGPRDVVTSLIILLPILLRPHGMFGREDIERV